VRGEGNRHRLSCTAKPCETDAATRRGNDRGVGWVASDGSVSGVGQRGGEASEVIREHTFRMDGGHSPPYGYGLT